ncbi:LysR substrate-binding domain-containing protein [uncultured Caballeronia sp.]|uniref:LysR family transcriptional regulator n=1 Tax=uncultured Caballeronia sp. TaxID=1827198 RepID=UPI001576E72D
MKDILSLKLYSRVAHLGSFSAAAREFGLAQSQVSRMVADLEAGLGARLLSRSTRAVVLTEAGAEFLARVEPILAALEDAENSVRESGELRGLLRVGMTTTMGLRMVMPRLAPFTERHPNLSIELLLDDKWQDVVREGVDVALRVGNLPDASGTSKFITMIPRVVVAAPSYLERAGMPLVPEDLTRHRIVGGPAATRAASWQFELDGKTVDVELHPNISTNSIAGAIACATGGLGITSAPSWGCQDELERGSLVLVLADWKTTGLPVHAYFPLGRSARKVARAFVDFVTEELRKA